MSFYYVSFVFQFETIFLFNFSSQVKCSSSCAQLLLFFFTFLFSLSISEFLLYKNLKERDYTAKTCTIMKLNYAQIFKVHELKANTIYHFFTRAFVFIFMLFIISMRLQHGLLVLFCSFTNSNLQFFYFFKILFSIFSRLGNFLCVLFVLYSL